MIVPMKKAHLVVLKEDQERLLQSLQKHSVLMLIKTGDNEDHQAIDGQVLNRIEKSIANLEKYREEKNNEIIVNYEEFIQEDPRRQKYLEETERINDTILRLQNNNQSIQEELDVLAPWKGLDIKLSDLSSPRYAKLHIGFIEARKLSEVEKAIESQNGDMTVVGQKDYSLAILYAVYYQDDETLLNELKNLGFEEYQLPTVDAYAKDLIFEKETLLQNNKQEIERLEENLKELASNIEELLVLNDQLNSQLELVEAKVSNITTYATCYIEGWVRSDEVDQLNEAIKEATDVYDLAITDPSPEEIPPTVTKNNDFTASFEVITDMFSKPNPNEVDPNPIMSIWYWILFGIMMGDSGYGLLMMIASHLFIKYKKPKGGTLRIIKIFYYSGITTIIWGILFGSFFGYDPVNLIGRLFGKNNWGFALIAPMDDPLSMLILSLAIGVLHIISGLIMKAARNFVDKEYFAIFADQVSWILILAGICLFVLPPTKSIGMIMVIVGAVTVVLTAGRHKKNLFGKITGGILGLYDIANYMSDILSYSRILALALSTAVIGMVMNMLAGMVAGSVIGFILAAVIFVVGHVFNIAMGLLSAYVHDSRLQYVEFFGKFYDGGGYEFKPLSLKLKYIDEVKTSSLTQTN